MCCTSCSRPSVTSDARRRGVVAGDLWGAITHHGWVLLRRDPKVLLYPAYPDSNTVLRADVSVGPGRHARLGPAEGGSSVFEAPYSRRGPAPVSSTYAS